MKLCNIEKFPHPPGDWQKFSYGQNVGWGFGNIENCIDAWFDEYKEYVEKGVNPLISIGPGDPEFDNNNLTQPNGHFTAIVHSGTTKIGCGMARDQEIVFAGVVWVCNYHPPGNIIRLYRNKPVMSPAYQTVRT